MLYLKFWLGISKDWNKPIRRLEYWVPMIVNFIISICLLVYPCIKAFKIMETRIIDIKTNTDVYIQEYMTDANIQEMLLQSNYQSIEEAYNDIMQAVNHTGESSETADKIIEYVENDLITKTLNEIKQNSLIGTFLVIFIIFNILCIVPSIKYGIGRLIDIGLTPYLIFAYFFVPLGTFVFMLLMLARSKIEEIY